MAKQTTGFLGGFSGKLGPAVGYLWNGKWCLRSRPAAVRNPRTERQMEARSAFKQQVRLAASMRDALMACLLDAARQAGMTPYNLFMAANRDCFALADSVLQVDYAHLRLSLGDTLPVRFTAAQWTADNVLHLRYDGGTRSPLAAHRDLVRVYVYDAEAALGYLSAPAYRGDKRLGISLPDSLAGRRVHLYAMVQSDRTGAWSETLYLGEMQLAEGAEVESSIEETADSEPFTADATPTAAEATMRPAAAPWSQPSAAVAPPDAATPE